MMTSPSPTGRRSQGQGQRPIADLDVEVLSEQLAGVKRYSDVCKGNFQALDEILVSQVLSDVLAPGSYDVAYVNAEFPDPVNEHDPQVARFVWPPW